jgi:hypothetical protein
MDNLDKLVKEELVKIRETRLVESLSLLNEIEDNDFFIQTYIDTAIELINEGYSIEEIETIAEQSFTDRLQQGVGGAVKNTWDKTNILGSLFGGSISMVKEQVIRWALYQLGMGPGTSNFIAASLTQVDPRKLLTLFKDEQHCKAAGPEVCLALVDGIGAYLQFGEHEVSFQQSYGKSELRNVLVDVLKQSNVANVLSDKICGLIWKN